MLDKPHTPPKNTDQNTQETNHNTPKKRGSWTTKEIAHAADLWSDGKTINQIAEALCRTRESVKHKISERRDVFPLRRDYRWDERDGDRPVTMKMSVSPYIHKLLRKEAKRQGVSMNTYVRRVVRDALHPNRLRAPIKAAGMGAGKDR